MHPKATGCHASGEAIASWFDDRGSGTAGDGLGDSSLYLFGQLRRRVRFVNESKKTFVVEPRQDLTFVIAAG